jgi:hypothetical protein
VIKLITLGESLSLSLSLSLFLFCFFCGENALFVTIEESKPVIPSEFFFLSRSINNSVHCIVLRVLKI